MKKTYPDNLIADINKNLPEVLQIHIDVMTDDQLAGLDYAITSLGEPRQQVVLYHYRDGLVYREIGERMKLTRSRIGQLNLKALRMLRTKDRRLYITRGFEGCADIRKAHEEYEEKRKRIEGLYWMMSRDEILNTPVSTFGYNQGNSLKAAGINTVAEMMEVMKAPKWYTRIRGIGRQTAYRIENHIDWFWSERLIEDTDPRYPDMLEAHREIRAKG